MMLLMCGSIYKYFSFRLPREDDKLLELDTYIVKMLNVEFSFVLYMS